DGEVSWRGDERAVDEPRHQQQLPEPEKQQRRDHVEQPVSCLCRYCVHSSSSARARVTSSSSTCQMSSLSAPNSGAADSLIRSRGCGKGTLMICLMRPGCAVMITQRSPMSNASSMEWVT